MRISLTIMSNSSAMSNNQLKIFKLINNLSRRPVHFHALTVLWRSNEKNMQRDTLEEFIQSDWIYSFVVNGCIVRVGWNSMKYFETIIFVF